MDRLWSMDNVLSYVTVVLLLALAAWVFRVNTQVATISADSKNHYERPAHPSAQKTFTEIKQHQAAQTANLENLKERQQEIKTDLKEIKRMLLQLTIERRGP